MLSSGGRETPAPPEIAPTPLAFVGAGDVLAATSVPWPAWKIVLLALLAAAEALLLVRLVHDARFVRASELV